MLDKNEFVESVIKRELGIDEIVKEAGEGVLQTESSSYSAAGSGEYVDFLNSVGLFLQRGTLPEGISDDDFQLLHRLTKYLVEIRNFKPTILESFGAAPEN